MLRRASDLALAVVALLVSITHPPMAGAQTMPARRLVREDAATYARVPRLALTVEQRWCSDASAPGCDFRGAASVHATPDGGLLASDAMGPLRLFGRDGRFVRELGRKGQGPGEYGFVVEAQVTSDGFVTWFDNTQMRFASVARDGRPGPIRRLMPPPTMANLFVVDTQLVIFDVPASATRGSTVVGRYRTVPVSGTPRVLAEVRTPAVFTPGSDMMAANGPFAATPIGAVGAGFDVAHSDRTTYAIDVFPARGTAWRLEIERPRRAVTTAEADSAVAVSLARLKVKRLAELPPPLRATLETLPAQHPAIQELRMLSDGSLWIRPTPDAGATTARWDGFRRDGSRIGQIRLPIAARVLDGSAEWLLVTERDADDLPVFVRYRVAKSALRDQGDFLPR